MSEYQIGRDVSTLLAKIKELKGEIEELESRLDERFGQLEDSIVEIKKKVGIPLTDEEKEIYEESE